MRTIEQKKLNCLYRKYHGKTGGIVGQSALTAFAYAKARISFEQHDDLKFACTPEEESYKDVYGEDPPDGSEFICVSLMKKCDNCSNWGVVASLGFVDGSDSGYIELVQNDLLCEYLAL